MKRNSPNLARPASVRDQKRRFLVFCEGKATERIYIGSLNSRHRAPIIIDLAPHRYTSPRELVKAAAAAKKAAKRAAKSDTSQAYDGVWCFFDRDEHPNIPDAFNRAHANGVEVAFSDPCFELWLLLHFEEQTAHLERQAASKKCADNMPGYEKTPSMDLLVPLYETAASRAKALRIRQANNDRHRQNPWTEADRFLDLIVPE